MRHVFLFLITLAGCAHAPIPDASDPPLCVVTRVDVDTGVATETYTFNTWGLVSYTWRYSAHSYGQRTNHWRGDKLVSAEVESQLGALDEAVYGPWQDRMVVAQEPTHAAHSLAFAYDPAGRLVTWTTHNVTRVGETTHTSERVIRRTYDESGRKTHEHETYNGEPSAKMTYGYDAAGRMLSVRAQRGNLDYVATVVRDEAGRVAGHRLDDGFAPPLWRYDGQGRLVDLGYGNTFVWNDRGEMVVRTLGQRVQYEYEAGRLRVARYPDRSMYKQTYSAACPVGFKHPLITPNTLYHEYYEGPPDHYTWSSY